MVKNKAIFLDRDGIINRALIENRKPYPPLRIRDIFVVDGIKDLIKMWHKEGYLVIVVTNQPDISDHVVSKRQVDKINNYLKSLVSFDDIFVCPHDDKDKCDCRKPDVGLFEQADKKYHIDFSESYMVGDRWKDIEAGKKIGCKTIFVEYHYDEKKPDKPDYIVENILDIEKIWRK